MHETLERIHKDLRDFGRGFARICEILGEDSQGFARLWERISGFMRLWERIARIRETLGEDLLDFGR